MGRILTDDQLLILREAHYSCKKKKSADRIKAILFLDEGFNYLDTARLLMLDDETIRRYERYFKEKGIDGLLEYRYAGSDRQLSKVQELGLLQHLRKKTYLRVEEICWYVKRHYQVSYSVSGMTQYLHRAGFVYKKMKVVPGKADREKQEAFIEAYQHLKEVKKVQDRIYFVDATHPTHNTHAAYGWIYKGENKTVKTNTGREHVNLNGAVDLTDLKITVLQEEKINTQAMIRLLTQLEEKQKRGKLFIILDNAGYNHSKALKGFLHKHKRLHFIFLPAYSPNLNVIERLWLFFHKKVLYNHYYETFPQFKKAIEQFFKTINQYNSDLKSLLTDNFKPLSI